MVVHDDTSPMNCAITHLGFLSPADFMICTRDDLNSLGSIAITQAQKNCIMNLCNFCSDQPLEMRDWLTMSAEIYEAWLVNPMTAPMRPTQLTMFDLPMALLIICLLVLM